ncbi:MAG: homocysteine S-methyltransferase family protein [Pseudomonadota bacterium]
MGQELVRRYGQPPTPLWSTHVMMNQPDLVGVIHDDYFNSGAQVATTNTYAIHHDRLLKQDPALDKQFATLHHTACTIASRARDKNGAGMIAGSIGPLGFSYRPDLHYVPEQAAELFSEIVKLHEPYVDVHLIETVSSIEHARGAMMGAALSAKPVWIAMSVMDDDGTRLRSGEPVSELESLVSEFSPAAVLINCSTPEAVSQALPMLAPMNLPFGAYANGFTFITSSFTQTETVDQLEARTDLSPDTYAGFCNKWVDQGASIIGGCCEVGPAHIAELARRFN